MADEDGFPVDALRRGVFVVAVSVGVATGGCFAVVGGFLFKSSRREDGASVEFVYIATALNLELIVIIVNPLIQPAIIGF